MVTPETDSEEKDDAPAEGAAHTLRRKSLKAAGFSFLLADAALFAYGIASKNFEIGSAAIFGWTEGLVGARYGNPKAEKQLEQVERQLGEYLRKQGVEIPKDPTTKSLTKEGGIIDHVESFLYTYPSQIMNVCYAMIGVQFTRDGIRNKTKDKNSMIAAGGFLIAGALAGLLIPEKKFDADHPAKGLWQKIQEKPLRLSGTLLNLNQVMLAKSALNERRQNPGKKNYMFKLLAVAGFTFGNTMLALSSKSYGGGSKLDKKTLNTLAETSARVILAQPPEVQNALLEQMAGFLASKPNVNMKAEAISAILHEKIAEVARANPPQAGWQARIVDANNVQPTL